MFSRLLDLEILVWVISNNEHIICWTFLKITVEVYIWLIWQIRGTTHPTGILKIKKMMKKSILFEQVFSKIDNNEISPNA